MCILHLNKNEVQCTVTQYRIHHHYINTDTNLKSSKQTLLEDRGCYQSDCDRQKSAFSAAAI